MGLVMWASSSWAGGRFGAGVFLSQCNIYWPAEHGVQAAIPQSIAFSIYGSAGHASALSPSYERKPTVVWGGRLWAGEHRSRARRSHLDGHAATEKALI